MLPEFNNTFVQFHHLTDHLQATLHTPQETSEKVVEVAKAWIEYFHKHHYSILQSLNRAGQQAAFLMEKAGQINAKIADHSFPLQSDVVSKVHQTFKFLIFPIDKLPGDLVKVALRYLTFQDLMRVGGATKNLRRAVLDIRLWRSNQMFLHLLQGEKIEGMEARDQFASVLKGYTRKTGKTSTHEQERLASALAADFMTQASPDAWRYYLEEMDSEGRTIFYNLLKNQDTSQLQFLYLPGYNWLEKEGLNFDFFLNKCPRLTGLHVGGGQTFMTDSVLSGLAARYPGLTSFNCELNSKITGSFLNSWPETKIETLELGECPQFQAKYISANIDKFPKLTKLRLDKLRLKDEDLSALVKLTKLEELNISGNPSVTDATLAVLAGLPSLAKLNLIGVKGITPAGLRALHEARPGLKIMHD